MKKLLIAGLLALFSIGANATITDELVKQYPRVAQYNATLIEVTYYDFAMSEIASFALRQNDKRMKPPITLQTTHEPKLDENCLVNFDKSLAYQELQNELLAKLNSNELARFEQFLQTPTGHKWYLELHKLNDANKTDTFYDVYDMNHPKNPYTKAEEQQIAAFAQQHKEIFYKIKIVIGSEQAKILYKDYLTSCSQGIINP